MRGSHSHPQGRNAATGARKAMPVPSGMSPALARHRLGDLTDVGFQRGARWSLAKTLVEAQHAVLA